MGGCLVSLSFLVVSSAFSASVSLLKTEPSTGRKKMLLPKCVTDRVKEPFLYLGKVVINIVFKKVLIFHQKLALSLKKVLKRKLRKFRQSVQKHWDTECFSKF